MSTKKVAIDTEKATPQPPPVKAEAILKHHIDADEALKAFDGLEGETIVIDEDTNRRLLRKIDLNVMPLLCVIYGLQYLDKTTLSYASIMGLRKDLALVGDNYQWLGSMFYFGYLAWEFPTNRLLQRLPLAKYSAFNIVMWGLVLALFACVDNFAGAVAVRFFLGLFESAVTPGFALFTSQWYTRNEQGFRTATEGCRRSIGGDGAPTVVLGMHCFVILGRLADFSRRIWFSFNGFGQIFGGLVAYGIAQGDRIHGFSIAPWKIVFLLTGILTSVIGVVFYFLIPDNQLNARFLTKDERVLAVLRIRGNQQGIGNKHFKWYQFREAVIGDPMVWAFVAYSLLANIPNGGITNFFSQLIVSFGYTAEESLLYGTPGGAVEVVVLIVVGYLGDRYSNRLLWSLSGLCLAILGMILIVALPVQYSAGRLAGYYLTQASPTPFVALLSMIASNISGYTKKTITAAMFLVAYCCGNIIGPQAFRPKDAPQYKPGEITILVCYGLALLDAIFIWWYYRLQNRKKALAREDPSYVKLENPEWLDLTDRENTEFVYSL